MNLGFTGRRLVSTILRIPNKLCLKKGFYEAWVKMGDLQKRLSQELGGCFPKADLVADL